MRNLLLACLSSLALIFTSCATEASPSNSSVTADSSNDSAKIPQSFKDDTVALPINRDSIIETGFDAVVALRFTRQYCGGAAPSKEILEQYETPAPLSNSTVVFREKSTRNEIVCTTDNKGKSAILFEPGVYDVYLTKSISPDLGTGFNADCKEWFKRKMATLTISSDKKNYSVDINFVCNPCDGGINLRP